MAVKEYVRQQLYGEMEPIRVQVALLQKQLQILDEKAQAIVPARNDSRESGRSALSEKKLQDEMSPRLENWMNKQEHEITENQTRIAKAENVLRELGALHDKFTQRHDSLVVCVQDLDARIENVDKAMARKMDFDASKMQSIPNGMLPSVPEDYASNHGGGYGAHNGGGALPPGYVPPPGHPQPQSGGAMFGGPQQPRTANVQAQAPGAAAHVWTACDHQASLEVEEFTFPVDRQPGVSLGMILRNDGSKLVVDQTSEGCNIPVATGDRIVAIEGIRADSKGLLELIRRTGKFQITCQRLLSTTL
jgi:hypothetical protein